VEKLDGQNFAISVLSIAEVQSLRIWLLIDRIKKFVFCVQCSTGFSVYPIKDHGNLENLSLSTQSKKSTSNRGNDFILDGSEVMSDVVVFSEGVDCETVTFL
jgi:hypothetical protein